MLSLLTALAFSPSAHAFCGTYVGEPGSTITNTTSQVLLARQGTRTTLTLINDFEGDPSDFALVISVPEVLGAEDVRTVIPELVEEAERYSGPRLVEYRCEDFYTWYPEVCHDSGWWADSGVAFQNDDSGGWLDSGSVEVEAEFEAGEYTVVILSAEDSGDLLRWLDNNGYGVTDAASALLQESIDAGAYFLAAQVNYELIPPDTSVLSPLQIGYDSEVMSLPIRLGTLNSSGAQDLVVYGINDVNDGQLRIVNYAEATLTDECMTPVDDFGAYYAGRLDTALPTDTESGAHWIMEYSWSPMHCDPCVDGEALPEWVIAEAGYDGSPFDATFTRLRVRYTPEQATQDLLFSLSGIQEQVQQRYIQYNENMEDRFPVCDEAANTAAMLSGDVGSCEDEFAAWTEENEANDPGCDDDKGFFGGASSCGGCASGGGSPLGAAAMAMGLMLGLGRRRDG